MDNNLINNLSEHENEPDSDSPSESEEVTNLEPEPARHLNFIPLRETIQRRLRRRNEFEEIIRNRINYRTNNTNNFQRIIEERNAFEDYIYDILVNPIIIIPHESDSFWDPVVVSLNNLDELETVVCEKIECLICTDKYDTFKKVKCCNNKICLDCASNWFERSVFCPFCKHDQRETSDLLPKRKTPVLP